MKNVFILFSIFLSLSAFAAKPPVHVYIVVNDNSMKTSDLNEWTVKLYLESKLAINEFEVIHYVYENRMPDVWMNEKKSKVAKYTTETIDCSYSPCSKVEELIRTKSTEKTKFFIGEGIFKCNLTTLRAETGYFENTVESIQSKIDEEIKINKSAQKELTLIFFIPTKESFEKAEVTVKNTEFTIKKGGTAFLSVEAKGASSIIWEPSNGLSCTTCKNTIASPEETTLYKVGAYNDVGCLGEMKSVLVTVENRCEDGTSACIIDYQSDEMLYRRTLDNTKWLIASSQPGSSIYYLICTRNCGEFFNVILYNEAKEMVWNREFSREEIEAGNKLHTDHPDSFIFKLNLGVIPNFDKKILYTFEIESRDTDLNSYEKFQSQLTKFVDCGFYE